MDGMCKEETLRREMRKIQSAIFFLTPGICMPFHANKCENIAKLRQKMIPEVTVAYISWSSDFALNLSLYLIQKHHTLGTASVTLVVTSYFL